MEDPTPAATRLSKVVAAQVPCSRREAEQYIAEGWVRVDGRQVDEPQFRVVPGARVEVDPKARLQPSEPATLLIHKPVGMTAAEALAVVSAATRWTGDTSGIRRTRAHEVAQESLLPLPPPASGLLVFSQDGRIVRKLREDANLMEQELIAEVRGTIAPDGLARMARGLVIDGRQLPPLRASWQSEHRLRIASKGIPPEWVPGMCEAVGLELTALRRLRIGRVAMGALPVGQWRYLPAGERF